MIFLCLICACIMVLVITIIISAVVWVSKEKLICLNSREENQLIQLYRKIENPYNRLMTAEYVKMCAKVDTGETDLQVPDSLKEIEHQYEIFCGLPDTLKGAFTPEEIPEKMKELEEMMVNDMYSKYYKRPNGKENKNGN